MKKLISLISFLVFILVDTSANLNEINNKYFEINFNCSGKSFWSYKVKQTHEILDFTAPLFEINGTQIVALPLKVTMSHAPVTLKNGVTEYTYEGTVQKDQGMTVQITFRVSPNSPVVRFRYKLESKDSHIFTKISGKDSLRYFSANFNRFDTFSEIQLSDFNENFHAFTLNDRSIDNRYFENNLSVTGPIFVAENKESSFLMAYEHGSQLPDKFIEFGLSENRSVSLNAVKGNYYNKQHLDSTHPFESIWFEVAGIPGSKTQLANSYRNFVLKDLAINNASRTPYIYYNTWGFQERNKCWNGQKYLSSMNLEHSLKEIEVAHHMGIDVFVLDAGWFGKTGDWQINQSSFPDNLTQVKSKLDSYNMKLGLWYSPTQAAVSSNIFNHNTQCRTSLDGKPSNPSEVWETEPSYNMCMVSNYWKDCAANMIHNAQTYGNIYFKWDAIYQYGCNDTHHNHGTEENSPGERLDCYAFELCKYLNKVVDSVTAVVPDAIVDFDVTEGWRSFGLQFLASGKYFLMNNGPYYDNYNLPMPDKMQWNNIFVYPGPARARICRSPLIYDTWIPSVLFLTHYLPDAPQSSETINIASLILGQNGFWGDLLSLSGENTAYIGSLIQKYKQVRDDITVSYPVTSGNDGSLPEIHEKINALNGKGVVAIFAIAANGHKYTYVTENKVDRNIWHNEDVSVSYDSKGRAIITCEFNDEAAKIIFFGVK